MIHFDAATVLAGKIVESEVFLFLVDILDHTEWQSSKSHIKMIPNLYLLI